MTSPKTLPTHASVEEFIVGIEPALRREDIRTVVAIMSGITGQRPMLWGSSMIGFGSYRYTYASGRTGDWPLTAVSSRKSSITIYIMDGLEKYGDLLCRLGPHTMGVSCLYIKTLEGVDRTVLHELITRSIAYMREKYPGS